MFAVLCIVYFLLHLTMNKDVCVEQGVLANSRLTQKDLNAEVNETHSPLADKREARRLTLRPDLGQPSAGGGRVQSCVTGNCRLERIFPPALIVVLGLYYENNYRVTVFLIVKAFSFQTRIIFYILPPANDRCLVPLDKSKVAASRK